MNAGVILIDEKPDETIDSKEEECEEEEEEEQYAIEFNLPGGVSKTGSYLIKY